MGGWLIVRTGLRLRWMLATVVGWSLELLVRLKMKLAVVWTRVRRRISKSCGNDWIKVS